MQAIALQVSRPDFLAFHPQVRIRVFLVLEVLYSDDPKELVVILQYLSQPFLHFLSLLIAPLSLHFNNHLTPDIFPIVASSIWLAVPIKSRSSVYILIIFLPGVFLIIASI
jgi:hypothetical protein